MNLTPKRLRALRLIQQRPGIRPGELVDICDRQESSWTRDGTFSGFDKSTANGAATRWGFGYAKPLIAAGLIDARYSVVGGWPTTALYLTPKGQEVARSGELQAEGEA